MSETAEGRIGFGCAYLLGGFNAPAARRLVHLALDRGVRHFDVAPGYGLGTAEETLAAALGRRRGEVTIATKVGLPGEKPSAAKLAIRSAAAPLRAALPALRARQVPSRGASPGVRAARFDTDFVRQSVERSLRRLRTERIDILLLHEVAAAQVTDELARLLEALQASGSVGRVGAAADRETNAAIARDRAALVTVSQHSWNLFDDAPIVADGLHHVTHRALMGGLDRLAARLGDGAVLARASQAVGYDLADPRDHAPLLIGAALAANPGGTTLLASRSRARLAENLRILAEPAFIARGRQLQEVLASTAIT